MNHEPLLAQGPVDVNVSPLPCPFCGGRAVAHETRDGWWVDCVSDSCPTQPSNQTPRHVKDDAIAQWNKRANAKSEPPAPLLAQVGSTDGLCGAVDSET